MGQLKQILREQILAEMTYDRQMADEEIADLIDRKMDACMENDPEIFPATLGERLKLHKELFDSFRRLDILQELVDDPRVTEIMVNGPDQVFVETGGKIGRWEKSFESREQLEDLIQQIVSSVNRIVNTSTPLANARLADGSRVHVVLEPVALNGPILTIRKFPEPVTMDRLMEYGSISKEAADLLKTLVAARYNIFVSGGTGAGKTTKCTLRVYPARRARDHDRRRGGAAVKPHRKSGTSGDPGCQCRGSRGDRDRRADPGGPSYETGSPDNRRGTRKRGAGSSSESQYGS